MDDFDLASAHSPSSEEGVEVPTNQPPPTAQLSAVASSAIGGGLQGAEPQDDSHTTEGETRKTGDQPLAQTRANADRPERHIVTRRAFSHRTPSDSHVYVRRLRIHDPCPRYNT